MKFTNTSDSRILAVHGVLSDVTRIILLDPQEEVEIPSTRVRTDYKETTYNIPHLMVDATAGEDLIDDEEFLNRTESIKQSLDKQGTVYIRVPWQRDPTPEECKVLWFLYPNGCGAQYAPGGGGSSSQGGSHGGGGKAPLEPATSTHPDDFKFTKDLDPKYQVSTDSPEITLSAETTPAADKYYLYAGSENIAENTTGSFPREISFASSPARFRIKATKDDMEAWSSETEIICTAGSGLEGRAIEISAEAVTATEGAVEIPFTTNLPEDSSVEYVLKKGSSQKATASKSPFSVELTAGDSGQYSIEAKIDGKGESTTPKFKVTVNPKP